MCPKSKKLVMSSRIKHPWCRQTDFTYFKVLVWGWYCLSTVLDDYSRYIVHWKLCSSMKADDVKRTVDYPIKKVKLVTKQKPKLLSDNGSCYISNELKSYLKDNYQMEQVHGIHLRA
jgi:putative transposase